MARITFNGEPGEVWTNDTGKLKYQFIVSWQNSCGLCSQYDHAIGPIWPIPMHRRCRCQQVAIPPDGTAQPFVDFREEIRQLDPHQQAAVVGRSNWSLIESGAVQWEEVVTSTRVRDLREVVSRGKLSVDAMTGAGVSKRIAETAYQSVNTPDHVLVDQKRKQLVESLRGMGLSNDQIRNAVGERIASRVGISEGPSGASSFKITPLVPKIPGTKVVTSTVKLPRKPKKPSKERPPAKPPQVPLDNLREQYRAATTIEQQREIVRSYVEQNRGAESAQKHHGMTDAERMVSVVFEGITYHYPVGGEVIAINTIRSLIGFGKMPGTLANYTRNVYLSTQRNSHDAHWEKTYNMPGFVSGATGGDGNVVVYNGNPIGLGTLAHETGHNLASAVYGDTKPLHDSRFDRAIASGEPPPSDYAKVSPDEDFAESVKAYVIDRDKFKQDHPKRYRAIDELLKEQDEQAKRSDPGAA